MPKQYPSDRLEIPGAESLDVGTAREFLDGYEPRGSEDAELLVIAQGLRKLLHRQVDLNENGHQILLEEEHERRRIASDEFLKRPAIHFPAEEAAHAAEINGPDSE